MKKTIFLTVLLLFCSIIAQLFVKSNTSAGIMPQSYSATIKSDSNEVVIETKKELFDTTLLKQVKLESQVSLAPIVKTEILYKNVKGTVYHAVESQCDNTPLITADNSLIDTARVNELRWVALSRDLISRKFTDKRGKKHVWTGKIKLGDTIWIDYDKAALWKHSHPNYNPKDSLRTKRQDLKYERLKEKYEKIKGYWIVHDVMGTQYTKRNRKGELILDEHGNKQIVKIHNAIDFLQHPDYGMLDVWDRNIIIAKRKVINNTPLLALN